MPYSKPSVAASGHMRRRRWPMAQGGAPLGPPEFQTNLATNQSFEDSPTFTDLVFCGQHMLTIASAGTGNEIVVPVADDGWPVQDFELVTQILSVPAAPITVLFKIKGQAGIISLRNPQIGDALNVSPWDAGTDTQIATFTGIAGRDRAKIIIRFINTKRTPASPVNSGLRGVIATRPGYSIAQVESQRFTTEWIASLAPFKVLRFMDWQAINGQTSFGQGQDFAKRPTIALRRTTMCYSEDPTRTTGVRNGMPLEIICELSNLTQKDVWIHLPYFATDAFVTATAQFLHANLLHGQKVYIEWVNEIWNSGAGFEQYAKALQDTALELNGFVDTSSRFGMMTRFIASATRTANVVTMTFGEAHGYVANGTNSVVMANVDLANPTTSQRILNHTAFVIQSTPSPTSITFNHAGPDGAVTMSGGTYVYDAAANSNLIIGQGSTNLLRARTMLVMRRTKEISELFRAVVGDANMMTRYRPVFAWQSAGTEFEREVQWLNAVYGAQHPPSYYLYGLAHAPYFILDGTPVGMPNLEGSTDLSLTVADYTAVLAATAKDAKRRYGYEEKAVTALNWGLELLCYEAGPDTSANGPPNGHANNVKKSQSQVDPAFEQPMRDFIIDMMRFGTNAQMPSQYHHGQLDPNSSFRTDRWGLTDDFTITTRPKFAAFNSLYTLPRPVPLRNIGLGRFDGRLIAGFYEDIDPNLLVTGLYPWLINLPFNTQAISFLWFETEATPRARTFAIEYTCRFAGWRTHVDINGVRVGTNVVLSSTPADLTTVKTLGPFAFTSRPGFNSIRLTKAAGGSGRDGEFRTYIFA